MVAGVVGDARRSVVMAAFITCPKCSNGYVFEDARGGFECTSCAQRFLINRDYPHGYGGPAGVLGPFAQFRWWLAQWIWPRPIKNEGQEQGGVP